MEGGACDDNAYEAKQALEASHSVVEIKIKTLDSQVYTCRVGKNVPVPDLKEQVALVTGVPSGSQRLICRGKVLKDEHALSAYDVEDGHTLHLVTRPIPSQSTHAGSDGIQSDEQEPFANTMRNRSGSLSHSVLVGTFNIPDRAGMIFPDINRIFSSVLSTVRAGTSVAGGSNGTVNRNDGTPAVPHNIEENGNGEQQEINVNQPRTTAGANGSREMESAPDNLPSLQADVGFFGAIPAVSRVRIVQQLVPDVLRVASQYVNRMEQVLAVTAEGERPTPSISNDAQTSSFREQTGSQQSPATGDGDIVAWASMIRHISEILSNELASELRRLADRLEDESNLQTATAHGSVLSAGILMERLGHLLQEVGALIRRDVSQDLSSSNLPPTSTVDHGRPVFLNAESSYGDRTATRRGVFYPLLARFQQLSPALFAEFSLERSGSEGHEWSSNEGRPLSDRGPVSSQPSSSLLRSVIQSQLEQIIVNAQNGPDQIDGSHANRQSDEPGAAGGTDDTAIRSRHEDVTVMSDNNITGVSENINIRPLLCTLETSESVQGGTEQFAPEEIHTANASGTADTFLQLKCSGQTSVIENLDSVVGAEPVILEKTTRETESIQPDGFQPLLHAVNAYNHNSEQRSAHDLYARMDDTCAPSSEGTVLKDFLSTLASRTDEKTDSGVGVEKSPQQWSLCLENHENNGINFENPGLKAVSHNEDVSLLNSTGPDTFSCTTGNMELANGVRKKKNGQDDVSCDSSSRQLLTLSSQNSKKRARLDSEAPIQDSDTDDENDTDGRRLLTSLESSASKSISNSGMYVTNPSPEAPSISKRQKVGHIASSRF